MWSLKNWPFKELENFIIHWKPKDPNGNPVQVWIRVTLFHERVVLPHLVLFILGDIEQSSSG